jgi:hypothetical protein
MMVTDFHAHAFPDALAERAIAVLDAETDEVDACLDGRLSSLLTSMDKAGIDRAVLCSIATKPAQFDPILAWSRQIASERIIPFPSIHPRDPNAVKRVDTIADAGFQGIKFHPYYQDFDLDDDGMFPVYERIRDRNLLVTFHTGFDIAFPRIRRADPKRVA